MENARVREAIASLWGSCHPGRKRYTSESHNRMCSRLCGPWMDSWLGSWENRVQGAQAEK